MQRSSVRNYDLQQLIGEGSYGKVYKAQRKSDKQLVAIKIVNIQRMDKIGIQSALNEIRILHSVTCENIVGYYEAFLDSTESHLWMVMEYVGGGDLAKAISVAKKEKKSFPEKIIWIYLIQSLRGLAALNRFKIIHRDIKPANLFISGDMGTIKLGDMNVSKVAKNDLTRTQIGTPSYLAPEVWENKPYDARCDIFSLGACMYELAALKLPFDARSMEELKGKIKNGTYALLPNNYSEGFKTIIYKCLTKNPSQRPTAESLLEHPLIVLKSKEYGLQEEEIEGNPELMRSIILPKNLSSLNSQLPKKNSEATRSQSMRVLQTPDSFKPSAKVQVPQSIKQIPIILEEEPEKKLDIRKPSKADLVRYQSHPTPQSETPMSNQGLKIKDALPSQRDLIYDQIKKGENIFSKKKDDNASISIHKPVQNVVVEINNHFGNEERGEVVHNLVNNMNKMNLPLKTDKRHEQSSKALFLPIQQPPANQLNDPKARFSFGEKREIIARYSDIHGDRIPNSGVASPNISRQDTGGKLSADENRKLPPSPVPRRMPPPKTPPSNVSPQPQSNNRQQILVRNSVQQGSHKNISPSPNPGSMNRINSASKMVSGSKKNLLDKSNPPNSSRNIGSRAKLPEVRLSVDGKKIQSGRNLSGVPLKKEPPVSTNSGKSNPPRPSTSSNNQPRGSARNVQPVSKSPIQGKPIVSTGARQSKVIVPANQSSKNSTNAQAKSPVNPRKSVQNSSNISIKAQPKIAPQVDAKKPITKLDDVLPKFNSQKASFVQADGNVRKSTEEVPRKQAPPVSPIRYRRA